VPARLVPELADAFRAASAAWVRWDMTPRWRRRERERRRQHVEELAARADRIRHKLGTDGDELRLIDLLDTRGRAPDGAHHSTGPQAAGPWRRRRRTLES
jgi:hypothetical protein